MHHLYKKTKGKNVLIHTLRVSPERVEAAERIRQAPTNPGLNKEWDACWTHR